MRLRKTEPNELYAANDTPERFKMQAQRWRFASEGGYNEIMGFFAASPKKRLSKHELKDALKKTKGLEKQDIEHINEQLNRGRRGGITKQDIHDAARRLRRDASNGVNRTEVRRATEQLLNEIDNG